MDDKFQNRDFTSLKRQIKQEVYADCNKKQKIFSPARDLMAEGKQRKSPNSTVQPRYFDRSIVFQKRGSLYVGSPRGGFSEDDEIDVTGKKIKQN